MADRPGKRPSEERPVDSDPVDEPRTTTTGDPVSRPPRPTGSGIGGWVIAVIVAIIVIIAASSYWNSGGNGGNESGSPSTAEQPGTTNTPAANPSGGAGQ